MSNYNDLSDVAKAYYDDMVKNNNPWKQGPTFNLTRQADVYKNCGAVYARNAALAAGVTYAELDRILPMNDPSKPHISIEENPWRDDTWNVSKQALYYKVHGEEAAKAQAAKVNKLLVGPPPPEVRAAQEGPGLDWTGYMARKRAAGQMFGQKNFNRS
jgi:hypothetical protein